MWSVIKNLAAAWAVANGGLVQAQNVNFGIVSEVTGPNDLDLTGYFVYAIDVNGPGGVSVAGVPFTADNRQRCPTLPQIMMRLC